MRNEAHNISQLLQSVKGCFDEIHFTDTGSTDQSVEFLEKINEQIRSGSGTWAGLPEIKIHHFEWVNDFSKARNYSFSHTSADYIAWLDLDDQLSDAKAFIQWRDTVMHSAHYWVALYNYAFDAAGNAVCKFIRERVVKNNFGFKWEYFVHEGIIQKEDKKYWPQRVSTWCINHKRTEEDRKQDDMRNIKLFEMNDAGDLHPRMKFYYGKELSENGFPEKGIKQLLDAVSSGKLDMHDLLLSIQYAAHSAHKMGKFQQAIDIALNGIKLQLERAEFWCILGDSYLSLNQVGSAASAYEFACTCHANDGGGVLVVEGHAYGDFPRTQLAKIYLSAGNDERAKPHVEWLNKAGHPEASNFQRDLDNVIDLRTPRLDLPKTDDVVITCPPGGVVTDWDENTLAAKGHGGSETAAIEVARWIKKKTNRRVKVFQMRQRREVMPSGVEYLPVQEFQGYTKNVEPYAHIAWRHSTRLTEANSFVWCHDLQCPNGERHHNYEKMVALSEFHKNYLIQTNGVPEEKIVLGFNGINPDDFTFNGVEKDPLKVIFSSSPDRGLVQSIDIVKKARELSGLDIKLHTFYGFDNMRKMGHAAWADSIEAKIRENDFVTHHGFVGKKELMMHFRQSAVWLYPADFIESSCITALEAMYNGCWSIVRDMGALGYTMKTAIVRDMCDVLSVEVTDEASVGIWANQLVEAIIEKKYKKVDIPIEKTWEKVADFFIERMNL